MKQTSVTCLVVIVLFAAVGLARGGQKDEKDAPARLIKAAEFLEEKPFDKDAKNIRAWAINWIITTDKVSVTVCSLLISGIDKTYKYSGEIFAQYTIGMAAFKLSSAEKAKDENAVQFSGINSALTAYSARPTRRLGPTLKSSFKSGLRLRDNWVVQYQNQRDG